ncbi:bifunctional diguanylate cyclase/phosphodiesterase, partial [Vibrio paracholerae]|nr:bifunctional diguanylate cyclase/phosphodiesterase [Vibrio paracholerae]
MMTQPHRNRLLSFEGQQGRLTAEDYPTIPQTRPFDDVARCLIEAQRDEKLLNALTHFFSHAEHTMALNPDAYQNFRSTLRAFHTLIEKSTEQQQLLAALTLWIRWLSASQKPSTPTEPMASLVVFASQRLADVAVPMLSELHSHHYAFERLRDSERRLHDAMDYAQIGHWSSPYEGTRSQWS